MKKLPTESEAIIDVIDVAELIDDCRANMEEIPEELLLRLEKSLNILHEIRKIGE